MGEKTPTEWLGRLNSILSVIHNSNPVSFMSGEKVLLSYVCEEEGCSSWFSSRTYQKEPQKLDPLFFVKQFVGRKSLVQSQHSP